MCVKNEIHLWNKTIYKAYTCEAKFTSVLCFKNSFKYKVIFQETILLQILYIYVCVCVCVYIYIYIYIYILFSPVKPKSRIIPSGQKIIQLWTFKFSWWRAQCNWYHRAIISLRKTKTGHIRIINLFPSCYGYWYESITPKITGLLQI